MKLLIFGFILSTAAFGECRLDDRQPSKVRAVGRIHGSGQRAAAPGCTATLISRSCIITAQHCVPQPDETLSEYVEFNVPMSMDDGTVVHSGLTDRYLIDKSSRVISTVKASTKDPDGFYRRKSIPFAMEGHDWAVVRLRPNEVSKKYAGDVQGFMTVNFEPAASHINSTVRMSGHGFDLNRSEKQNQNAVQQTSKGTFYGFSSHKKYPELFHDVVGPEGTSGSAIVLDSTGEIIGIHTKGGCENEDGYNGGTLVDLNKEFKKAILSCLKADRL